MIKQSYAKINLALNVVNKTKPEKLHDLDMLNITINLKDYIKVSYKKDNNKGIIISSNNEKVPVDSSNTVYKVIAKFQKNFNISDTISAKIYKYIPMEAGLGGGSGDAATALDILNKHYRTNMTVQQRMKFLEEISSDAVFMEVSQISRVKGTGNKVEPLNIRFKYKIFVIKPFSGCNTAKIYGSLDYKNLKRFNINKAVTALEKNDLETFAKSAGNSLQEAAIKDNPELEDIFSRLHACEFDYVALSGSGSTVFAIAKSNRPYKVVKKLLKKENYELYGVYKAKNYHL